MGCDESPPKAAARATSQRCPLHVIDRVPESPRTRVGPDDSFYMVQYVAYFDDSGHPNDQDVVLVAGFVSTKEQWHLFERDWRQVLDPLGIDVFHMADFEGSPRWSRFQKDVTVERLARTVATRAQFLIAHVVPMAAYRTINEEYAFEQEIGAPYALAARTAARSLNEWKARQPGRDEVLLVFEHGSKHKGDFIEVMKRDGLPTPSFAAKECLPLQAADFLAWETFNRWKNPSGPMRWSLDKLLDVPGDHSEYTEQVLLEMCTSRGRPVSRYSELPPNREIVFHSLMKRVRKRSVF